MENKIVTNNDIYSPKEESKSQIKRNQILNVIFFIFGLCTIEYFTRDYSKEFTLKYFSTVGKCQYLSYFEFYSLGGRYFLLFMILAYVNVPAALSYIFLDCFGVFLNGVIRFFYFDDRPFWKNPQLKPCFCATDYGNPSTTGINVFIMFAVFYKAFTYKPTTSTKFKALLWFISFINIIYIFLIRMFQNVHFLHQLLFGIGIGYALYYIYFEILCINFDDNETFINILKKWKLITFITTIVWIFVTIVHYLCNFQPPEKQIVDSITQNCPIRELFSFDNESYSKSVRLFEFIGCLIGAYMEYHYIFKKNDINYLEYNGSDNQFHCNRTPWWKSLLRFLIYFFSQRLILAKLILGKGNSHKFFKMPFMVNLILQGGVLLIIHGILIFFVIKYFLKCIHLTGEKPINEVIVKNIEPINPEEYLELKKD